MIERAGPTNLITTTTALRLHHENETRLSRLASDDTAEQTPAVLEALAQEDDDEIDYGRWHALQRWLELGDAGSRSRTPSSCASWCRRSPCRLRRDFGSARADPGPRAAPPGDPRPRRRGRIVATIDDYAVVRELSPTCLGRGGEDGQAARSARSSRRSASSTATATSRGQPAPARRGARARQGPVSRRVRAALEAGHLVNREERRGRPHRLLPGDPRPPTTKSSPAPRGCAVARLLEGIGDPPPPLERRT